MRIPVIPVIQESRMKEEWVGFVVILVDISGSGRGGVGWGGVEDWCYVQG